MKNLTSGTGAGRAQRRTGSEVAPEIVAAPFLGTPIEPIEAPMWPIHQPGWFQPETTAAPPSWSGLNIERRHRIPAPDFVRFPVSAFDRAAEPDDDREPLCEAASPRIPVGALELLGWDARVFAGKKEFK